MPPTVLALDVGGANLKAAHSTGPVRTQPFELWKQRTTLAAMLRSLIESFPPFDLLAVTMTGELCDCYATRRDGVNDILDSVEFASQWVGRPAFVWRTDGTFADLADARAQPLLAAAANWLALAMFAGRLAPSGCALLIDIGSTTTDVIPLVDGKPVPQGRTDAERMRVGELVYTGVRRTPVCALLGADGAAEWFATTHDVYLLLGHVPEASDDEGTADGRPATRAYAHARLARMMCADVESFSRTDAVTLAQQVCERQVSIIRTAVEAVCRRLPVVPRTVVIAGSGEFLARMVLLEGMEAAPRIESVADQFGPAVSQAACAHALASLAQAIEWEHR